ncbi:uncharacterized protein LOC113234603 [Hyposmocoma kahamanoa]|uniref:uncharacterized protein LOC113234603 n=1 Tax=Hyposmocoma kahamanoa TaxID=1477025 RepID=UPI000E6D9642|nr:uncharacterized protein LOC113234603 [Hyposmocoma kahamanoa]
MRLILLLLSCLTIAHTYKILVIFQVPSRSHNTIAEGVVRSLLKAGHEVTWVTPFDNNKPQKNLVLVHVGGLTSLLEKIDMTDSTNRQSLSMLLELGRNVTSIMTENKQFRDILLTQQFDAVITEWFFTDTPAG